MSGDTESGGGAATHAGTNYQDYAAAWTAVQILAEQDVTPPWGLPAKVTLEALHAEAPRPIDDLTVYTSANGKALAQAKHTVALATTQTSPLGSTIAQFVREYHTGTQPFDPQLDRFVLITSSQSSGPIKVALPAFLQRMRTSSHPDDEWTSCSQDEQAAASVLRAHLTREWQALKGATPGNSDLTALARLIYVHILDVDPGGHDALDAKNTLRQRILKNPTDTDTAWNTLITTTGTYAASHQRAGRRALQEALTDAGLGLQAQRSYREDIERLKAHTKTTLDMLLDSARITVGVTTVTVQRAPIADARAVADEGHLLILGMPGAGKSGALHELADGARSIGTDVVLFAVEQLEAVSIGGLRNELGLHHELVSVLEHWPGTTPGYLIIDALDAARTEGAVRTLHALIDQVIRLNSRWRVIASVRKFDLRYNTKLRRLFSGPPPTVHIDNEFRTTRHVNIPVFTEEEIGQVSRQVPEFGAIIDTGPTPLQELLRLPFNLRLLAELVATGMPAAELQPLTTQLDLLDRYWQERIVRSDKQGDGRELVLRRTTHAMVERRALRVQRAAAIANDAGSGTLLDDLLSTHVLAEWTSLTGTAQRDVLTFPHHLLFDYAVARLAVPTDEQEFVARLTAEPDLLLSIRPSIDLYLQRLWHADQDAFWRLTLKVLRSGIPEVGKLIAPSVAAMHATTVEQTQPLLACLQDSAHQDVGIAVLQHVLATIVTHARTASTLTLGPWIVFLHHATEHLTPHLANILRPYTHFLTERVDQLTPEDREYFGEVARRLLAYALEQGNCPLAIFSIDAVTATIATDQRASITLLRECITRAHLSTLGFRTLHWLARNIRLLAAVDPVFARDLYIAAFRYRDKSTETTSMGGSQILPMSSHRKQDYDSGLYQLTEHYPAVLANNPHEAIDALLTIIDEYVRTEHKPADTPVSVHWNGYDTSLLQDYSSIWDEVGSQDHELKMLDAVQHFLEHTTDPAQAAAHLHQVAAHHPPAIIWRRLLAAGASQPGTIGRALRSLTWDPTILISYDTTKPAGKLLNAIGPTLTNEEHESIENAIMDIPTREGVNVKVAEQYRDRLLGCLDLARLVTDRARERYEQIKQTGGPPSNYEEPVIAQWGTLDVIPHNEDPVIGRLLEPVAAFAAKYLNGTPSTEEVTAILPAIKDLHDALKTADPKPWQAIENTAQCGVAIGRTEIITEEQVALLLPIILDITNNDNPPPDANEDQFSPVTGWSTAPRITAAAAITQLARHPSCYTTKTHDAIQRLSKDPVRAVRVQIVTRVLCLFKTDPDFMWELIEGWANNDQNPTVIAGALHALHRLPTDLAHRTIPLTLTIFARTTEETDKEVRDACVHIWVHLSLWAKDAASDAMLNQMLDDPVRYAADLRRMVIAIEGYLPAKEEHISKSAFALLGRLLTSVTQAMQVIAEANRASTPWSPDAQEQNASLFKCADTLAQRLYFVSGAFKSPEHEGFFLPPSEFYSRAALLLKLLAPLGHPHTAQYLVDTLMYFINVDPPGVLLLISEAVAAGNEYGYQYETLAEGLMVGIVERYLAEYRPLLRERKDCHTALMRILDVFVRVGWPSAHQLTYQLSDIYR